MLGKIGVIGGGYIGGVLVQEIAQRRLAREVGLSDPAPFVNKKDPPERQAVQRTAGARTSGRAGPFAQPARPPRHR